MKINSLILALSLTVLVFSGCVTKEPHPTPQQVTFDQLSSNPKQYNGRDIIIEGFYFHGFEIVELETISGYVDELHELLKEGSLAERRAFIRGFVREVKVTGNEVVLNYTMLPVPDNVTIKKEGVLPTVQYGGRYWT